MIPVGPIHTIPRRLYWSGYTAWHARRDLALPYWPVERLQAQQDRRVRHIARYAYETVPYYRDLFDREGVSPDDIRVAEDLKRLPIVEADELTLAPERFVSTRFQRERGVMLHSSGVSGNAKTVYWDPAGLFQTLASKHRYRQVLRHYVGATYGYREMSISNPLNVSAAMRDFYTRNAWFPPSIEFERGRALTTSSFDDILAQINECKPMVLGGSGVTLGALYRYAQQQQVPVHRPKVMHYGASTMPAHDRALIEEEYGVPVISKYQSAEFLRIAFQCERREGFHICTDQVVHRVVDDRGRDIGPGQTGRIVLTSLVNHATVLLNYALGDLVEAGEGPCACGRTLPVINAIQGRAFDLVVLPKGQRVHADVLYKTFPLKEHLVQTQLEQFTLQRYTLRVVSDGAVPWEELRAGLDRQLREMIAPDIELSVERRDYFAPGPTGKIKACISHLT